MGDLGIPNDQLYLRPRGIKWVSFSVVCVGGLLVLCAARRGWLSGYSFQSPLESVHVDYDTLSMTGYSACQFQQFRMLFACVLDG